MNHPSEPPAETPLTADERHQMLIARHDDYCYPGCPDDVSTYPKVGERLYAAVESILSARETALRETIAQELIERGPVINYELNYDGTEDPLRAAYVEGHRDAVGIVRGQA